MKKEGKPVSDEMNKVLNHLTGINKPNISKQVKEISKVSPDWYQCAWYDGCYYCQAVEMGPWQLINCVA